MRKMVLRNATKQCFYDLLVCRRYRSTRGVLRQFVLIINCVVLLHMVLGDRKRQLNAPEELKSLRENKYASGSANVEVLYAQHATLTSNMSMSTARTRTGEAVTANTHCQFEHESTDTITDKPLTENLGRQKLEPLNVRTSLLTWLNSQPVSKSACATGPEQAVCNHFINIAKKRNVSSILDLHCQLNIGWMPIALHYLHQYASNLTYSCASVEAPISEEVRSVFGNTTYELRFETVQWWQQDLPKGVHLLIAIDTLRHLSFGRVYSLFHAVRQSGVELLLMDNYPQVSNSVDKRGRVINVRRRPFFLPAPVQILQHIEKEDEHVARQLVLYRAQDLVTVR
eukprot:Plantae.Rhodophyta-Purpureofilum_apyrenoidigerum.ctg27319.p1 GENE.Plantae.Rhodophyta-Purpureofilum_apyrenoidigerum.ctg27319~~Plantae.Rhodophyta-Purpureofilum_apyrenoidigerum.ctg27319.p1  ORF type:complete len:341 (-),score=42.10 Plantae.Rhodophyta-Purpureofilum_apyrenoidigerum.ctg27319:1037-2059(-)